MEQVCGIHGKYALRYTRYQRARSRRVSRVAPGINCSSYADAGYAPVLLWFRKDLRTTDHPGILAVQNQSPVVPIVTLDDKLYNFVRGWANGADILKHSILNLKRELQMLDSDLAILNGDAKQNLVEIVKKYGVSKIVTESEVEDQWIEILNELERDQNVSLQFWNTSIWKEEDYTDNFRSFRKQRKIPQKPLKPIKRFPSFPEHFRQYAMDEQALMQLDMSKLENSRSYISSFPYAVGQHVDKYNEAIRQVCEHPQKSLRDYLTVVEGSLHSSSRILQDSVRDLSKPAAPRGSFAYLFSCALSLGLLSYRQVYNEALKYETERNGGRFPFSGISTGTAKSATQFAEGGDYAFQLFLNNAKKVSNGSYGIKYWKWKGILTDYLVAHPRNGEEKKGSILLVHGFGAFGEQWRDNVGALSEAGYSVFAPTMPGYGRSHKPPIQYTTELWVEFLRDFTSDVIGDKVIVVGNSIGGYLSCLLSSNYPGAAQGLVLINSAGRIVQNYNVYTDIEKVEEVMNGNNLGPPRWFAVSLGTSLFTFLELTISRTLKNLYPVNPTKADQFLTDNIYKSACDVGAKDVFSSVFYLAPPKPLNFLISQVYKGPTLVLQGVLDPLNDAKSRAVQLESLCSNVQVELLQAGHCPHDELPRVVNQRILQFAQQIQLESQSTAIQQDLSTCLQV